METRALVVQASARLPKILGSASYLGPLPRLYQRHARRRHAGALALALPVRLLSTTVHVLCYLLPTSSPLPSESPFIVLSSS
jgi:hypothetical protein